MIAFRRAHPVLRKETFYTDTDLRWFAPNGGPLDWADQRQKAFACLVLGRTDPDLLLLFNAGANPVDCFIPASPSGKIWRLAADTSRAAPNDLFEPGKEPTVQSQIGFRLEARSSAILLTDDEVLHGN
jgi:glycogen operon protein